MTANTTPQGSPSSSPSRKRTRTPDPESPSKRACSDVTSAIILQNRMNELVEYRVPNRLIESEERDTLRTMNQSMVSVEDPSGDDDSKETSARVARIYLNLETSDMDESYFQSLQGDYGLVHGEDYWPRKWAVYKVPEDHPGAKVDPTDCRVNHIYKLEAEY